MIEENAITGKQTIAFPVIVGHPMRVGFRTAIGASWG
jgi:hypothetical protein